MRHSPPLGRKEKETGSYLLHKLLREDQNIKWFLSPPCHSPSLQCIALSTCEQLSTLFNPQSLWDNHSHPAKSAHNIFDRTWRGASYGYLPPLAIACRSQKRFIKKVCALIDSSNYHISIVSATSKANFMLRYSKLLFSLSFTITHQCSRHAIGTQVYL